MVMRNNLNKFTKWLSKNRQKRHLFLSDGWGAGGLPLTKEKLKLDKLILKLIETSQEKSNKKNDSKKQQNQRFYKWTIPGLFGEI